VTSRRSRKQRANLTGKVVAITGAARGIGLATAKAFLQEGCQVAIGDIDADLAIKTAVEIGAHGYAVDVTDVDSYCEFLDDAERNLGPLDILVNNAGIMPIGPLPEEPEHVTQRILDVNLLGAIHGNKLAMSRMRSRGSGHIINVASAVGRFAVPNAATYSASKFGVIGLAQSVRGELRGSGVEVSVILPAATNTELVSGLSDTGKVSQPEDIAEAIIGVVRRPRFETWIPRANQRSFRVTQMLPYPTFEALAYKAPATNIFMSQDAAARAAYEDRVRK